MVAERLTRHSRELVESFHDHLLSLPEVLSLYHLPGADDFLVHVGVRDSDHLSDFALSAFTNRPEVAQIETRLIFELPRNPEWTISEESRFRTECVSKCKYRWDR